MKYLIGKTSRLRHRCYDGIKEEVRKIHRRIFDSKPKAIIKIIHVFWVFYISFSYCAGSRRQGEFRVQ